MNEKLLVKRAKFEASIGSRLTFWNYLSTYQNAFNVLIDNIKKEGVDIDMLAYPMLFLARHCLELGFKTNIDYFKNYSDKTDFTNSKSHNLNFLYNGFKFHISETVKNLKSKYNITVKSDDLKDFQSYCKVVEKFTNQFEIIDKSSINFRYPVDKDNKKVFEYTQNINLLDIKNVFDKSMILIYQTSTVFLKYTSRADEKINEITKKE